MPRDHTINIVDKKVITEVLNQRTLFKPENAF